MRLYEFIEKMLEDEQMIKIVCKGTVVFDGMAINAYKGRKGILVKYWRERIDYVSSSYNGISSYLIIVLDDRYIMD